MKTYHIFKKTLPLIFIATLFLFTSCQISNDEISNNETEINEQNTTTTNNIVSEDSTENTSIEEDDIVKIHSPTYVADDSKTLDESLTTEYDINTLQEYFKNRCTNDIITYSEDTLKIDEVDKKFPLEVIRTDGYSVYKVKQGGYFYVFWADTMEPDYTIYSEPSVYFTAYISSSLDENLFNSITPNISTAQDIYEIDPNFELKFTLSSCILSHSFLNDNSVVQVMYYSKRKNDTYEGILVKEISIIDRESAPSCFSRILSKDLPQL